MQNIAKSTSRGESGEIKNEYALRKKATYVLGPKPKKKKKKKLSQAGRRKGLYTEGSDGILKEREVRTH